MKHDLKTIKYLDVQYGRPIMPDDVKDFWFDYYARCNDVWIKYTVGRSSEDLDEDSILDQWLLDNTSVEKGEEIMLSYWW